MTDVLSLILFMTQAAKLANTLSEAMQAGTMTPEEAAATWQKSAATWSGAVDMWRATPTPTPEG